MADSVLFIGANRPIVGREQQALDVAKKFGDYYEKLQAAGRIESFDYVLLDPHGGDLNQFALIKGTAEKLDAVKGDEEFRQLVMETTLCTDGVGVISGIVGERVRSAVSQFAKMIGK
jgi:hypothetical protein